MPGRRLRRRPRERRRRRARHQERLRLRRHGYRARRTSPRSRDPAQRLPRSARRASSASRRPVSQPDDDVRDIDNAAFGVTGFMREILGYAPIEPDGSVKIKVPANVAFQFSILDCNGRRISPYTRNWLQVRPGEVLECNGCHQPATAQNPRSHGRAGLFAAVNTGAPTTGQPFPNTNADVLAGCRRDDGADPRAHQLRQRHAALRGDDAERERAVHGHLDRSGRADGPGHHLQLRGSHVHDAAAHDRSPASPRGRPSAASSSTTPSTSSRCGTSLARSLDPMTMRRARGQHLLARAAATTPSMRPPRRWCPAASSICTAVASDEEPLQLRSYRELFFSDNEQEVSMGRVAGPAGAGPARRERQSDAGGSGCGPVPERGQRAWRRVELRS